LVFSNKDLNIHICLNPASDKTYSVSTSQYYFSSVLLPAQCVLVYVCYRLVNEELTLKN